MACELTRNDVSKIVLGVLRRIHRDNTITEFSRFGIELMVSHQPTAAVRAPQPERQSSSPGGPTSRFTTGAASRTAGQRKSRRRF